MDDHLIYESEGSNCGTRSQSSHSVRGFRNMVEAQEYKERIEKECYGYGPSISIVEKPEIVVHVSMWNSCD